MGQYYKIVNLTKRQWLSSHTFGDGLKLMEFGASGGGMMMAFAPLLADGNGRGGGDIFSSKYRREERKYVDKKRKSFPQAEKFNSPLIGSWAGDRIIIAGDYADPLRYLTTREVTRLIRILKKDYEDNNTDDRLDAKTIDRYSKENANLYSACDFLPEFVDISEQVLAMLKDAGEWEDGDDNSNKWCQKVLKPDMVIGAAGKTTKKK